MASKISAYLIVYNDWDMLEHVLRSIEPVVDDIVVVDGAYEWLAPYHRELGWALERSDDRLHAILQDSGIPFRLVTGVWNSESEKRIAGYESCRHRYVCRVDADEIVFFDQPGMAQFIRRGAVAQVEIPIYVAPGWVLGATQKNIFGSDRTAFPRAGFLFDRDQVPAALHLNYLWLNSIPRERPRPLAVERQSVGFVAHLPQWRTAENAARRSAFYLLNWARERGLPWISQLRGRPISDLASIFEFVPPRTLHEIMLASRITPNPVAPAQRVLRSPLAADEEARFASCHANRLASVRSLNDVLAEKGLHFTPRIPLTIDLTADRQNIADGNVVRFEFEEPLSSVQARLYSVHSTPPWGRWIKLELLISGRHLEVTLSEEAQSHLKDALRVHIELRVQSSSGRPLQQFRLRRGDATSARPKFESASHD